ncbi:MAG: hypothetical protein AB7O91_04150 [Sphingomonas sp.]
MKLIADWRDVLRHWSLWLGSAAAVVLATWALLPVETRALFPPRFGELFPLALALASLAAKFIKQRSLERRKEKRDAEK